MSTKKKILISAVLIVFISLSVFMSFNIVARPTYEFEYSEEYGGYEFSGFNGNSGITVLNIDERLEKTNKDGNTVWEPVEGEYITSVQRYTVLSDEYIEEIYIGEHVKNIDECAFAYLKQLKAIHVDENNAYYTDVDGVLYTKDMKTLIVYPLCHETDGDYTAEFSVPDTVTRIAEMAFYKCDKLQNVILPEGLEDIGEMCFFKCSNVSLIELPETVKFLGCDAFSYCSSMKYAMYIPASMEEIEHHCFYKCDGLERFYVGCKEDEITLGGKWMPKSENSFSSDEAIFEAPRADYTAYNAQRTDEEYVPPVETDGATATDGESNEVLGGMNKTAVILLIALVFVPGTLIVSVDVIRNLFKEDFLMTKKGKAKLRKFKDEKERIHEAYVNGEYADEEPVEIPEDEDGEEED